MICGCPRGDAGFNSTIRMASQDFVRAARCKGSSETATPGWWSFIGAQKNDVPMWSPVPELLRSQAQAGTGSLVWGLPSLPGHRDTAHRVRSVRHGEAGVAVVPRGQPLLTKRFAFYVGRRCRASTIKDIAEELHLDWQTVKDLEKQYMREQLRRAGRGPSQTRRTRRDQVLWTSLLSSVAHRRQHHPHTVRHECTITLAPAATYHVLSSLSINPPCGSTRLRYGHRR